MVWMVEWLMLRCFWLLVGKKLFFCKNWDGLVCGISKVFLLGMEVWVVVGFEMMIVIWLFVFVIFLFVLFIIIWYVFGFWEFVFIFFIMVDGCCLIVFFELVVIFGSLGEFFILDWIVVIFCFESWIFLLGVVEFVLFKWFVEFVRFWMMVIFFLFIFFWLELICLDVLLIVDVLFLLICCVNFGFVCLWLVLFFFIGVLWLMNLLLFCIFDIEFEFIWVFVLFDLLIIFWYIVFLVLFWINLFVVVFWLFEVFYCFLIGFVYIEFKL